MLTKHKKHVKMLSTLYILNTSPPKGTQSSSSLHNVQHKTDRLFELFARLLFHLGFFFFLKKKNMFFTNATAIGRTNIPL